MSRAEGPGATSIAVSIFTLVLTAVLTATVAFFLVTFNGPPPKEPPRGLDSIAYALKTGTQPGGPGPTLRIVDGAPAPSSATAHRLPAAEAQIAAILKVPPRDVVMLAPVQPRDLGTAFVGQFVVGWRRGTTWRTVENPAMPLFTHWHWVTLATMFGVILLLSVPAWRIARAVSQPLRQLADAATHARAGAPLGAIPASGAREVRDLSRAVAAMHGRLAHHAEGRTTMLAAIAHDMGTPLSRLAFRLEALPDDARVRALADIEEMRAMLGSALRFARDEATSRVDQRIDLGSLLDSLVEDMRVAGAPVELAAGARVIVRGDPAALRRMFGNLIENAVRYGRNATIGWTMAGDMVAVTIDDSGPGFDPAQSARLFEPFVRGDPSRNRGTGGTGLGLAIVRSIVEAHRGGVTLGNRPAGGRVTVELPALRG